MSDESTAHDLTLDFDRGHTDFGETEFRAKVLKQFEVSGAAFAKGPLVADANLV